MSLVSLCRPLIVVIVALAAGCAANPSGPQPTGQVRLTAHVNRIQIARGATAVATFRVENGTGGTVTLHFSSGCQVMPFIVTRPGNQFVYPSTGGWVCTQALTELTLPPNGVSVTEVTVINGATTPDAVGLAPGTYEFYARLHSSEMTLESERVILEVL